MMGISIWQLLIILVIVVLLFGTKKLRNMGGDLGSAIKNFKKAVGDGSSSEDAAVGGTNAARVEEKGREGGPRGSVIEGEVRTEKDPRP